MAFESDAHFWQYRWRIAVIDIEDPRQAEREFRNLLNVFPEYMCVHGVDGKPLYANDSALDFLGFTLDDFRADDFQMRAFYPEDVERVRSARNDAMSGGESWEVEARIRRKDGQYRRFLFRGRPLRNEEGNIICWFSSGIDIEDRKRVEGDLQLGTEIQAVFQKLIHSSMDGILAFDKEGRYTVWNPALERIFGINESQRLGKKATDLCPFFQQTGGKNCYTKALAGKGVVATDIPYFFPETGKQTFLDGHFSPLLDLGGKIVGGLAIIRDVTERKRAEDALRRSEAYLEEAQRLSHTGSFAHDANRGEITYWSPEAYRTFGFDPAEGPVTFKEARSRIHPDDLPRFEEYRERGILEKTGVEIDFRVVLPDKSIKYVHCVSRPVVNASGEVVELVGTNMDVTEQHQARAALEKALEEIKQLKEELYRENLALKEEIDQASMFEEIVGTSQALRRVLVQVAKVAPTDSTVLIAGETGTGKELIARAIHKRSQRASRAFVSVNCAAIPQALIGSELFGHEKGAFTGATQRRLGRFELADGGTLFLDEVGDLPAETQIALLRVLQERQIERIGGTQSIAVNVRVIAATNRDLKAAVTAGAFRSDLFYRLNVFPVTVPPLRDRKDDIPLLVEYLIERYASKAGKKIKNIHTRTLELFQAYDWPGNIRELQNVIERAVILCDGETFSVDESWLQSESLRPDAAGPGLARIGADRQRELIESALAKSRGRIAGPFGAAAKLGIPRSTLETKIRKLGIRKHQFNSA
jgi:PAS domain S-box-containing protein